MIEGTIKKGLGRGLSSLLGETKKTENTKLAITALVRNKFQPRKHFNKESLEELSNSIKERGVIQPIIVRPDRFILQSCRSVKNFDKFIKYFNKF